MKIGQVLSTIDFTAIPESEREQFEQTLATLLDDVPPLPWSKLEKLVRSELGGPVGASFAEFEPGHGRGGRERPAQPRAAAAAGEAAGAGARRARAGRRAARAGGRGARTELLVGQRFEEFKGLPAPERDRFGEIAFRFFFGTLNHLGRASGDPHPGNTCCSPTAASASWISGTPLGSLDAEFWGDRRWPLAVAA